MLDEPDRIHQPLPHPLLYEIAELQHAVEESLLRFLSRFAQHKILRRKLQYDEHFGVSTRAYH